MTVDRSINSILMNFCLPCWISREISLRLES